MLNLDFPGSSGKPSTFQKVSGLKRLTVHLLATYNEILHKSNRSRVQSFKISEVSNFSQRGHSLSGFQREFEPGSTLKHDEYRVLDQISQGKQSIVLRGLHIPRSQLVAIKVLRIGHNFSKHADKEAKILKYLQCLGQDFGVGSDLVVKLIDQFTHIASCELKNTKIYRCLVFEHLYSPLSQELRLSNPKGMALPQVYLIAWQILAALWLLSSPQVQIVHANLTPQNILLVNPLPGRDSTDENTTTCGRKYGIKLIDFGQSCWMSDRMLYGVNHPSNIPYMAPEALLGLPKTPESDLWSAGCVIFEILTGQPLFGGDSIEETLAQIIHLRGSLPEKMQLSNHQLYMNAKQKPVNWDKVNQEMSTMAHINRSPHKVSIISVLQNIIPQRASSVGGRSSSGVLIGANELPSDLESLGDLLDSLLEVNPENRIQASAALKHPFLTKSFSRQTSLVSNNDPIPYEEAEFQHEQAEKSAILNLPVQTNQVAPEKSSAKKRPPIISGQSSANSSLEGDIFLSHQVGQGYGSSFQVSESCPSTGKKAGTGGMNIQNDFIPTIIEEQENNSPKTTKISILCPDQQHTESSFLFSQLSRLQASDENIEARAHVSTDVIYNNNDCKENQEPPTTPATISKKLSEREGGIQPLENLKLRNQQRRILKGSQLVNQVENLDSVFGMSLFQQSQPLQPLGPSYSERVSVFMNNHGMEQKMRPSSTSSRKYLFRDKEPESNRTSGASDKSGPFVVYSSSRLHNNNSQSRKNAENDFQRESLGFKSSNRNSYSQVNNLQENRPRLINLDIPQEPFTNLVFGDIPRAVPDFRTLLSRNSRSFITALRQNSSLEYVVPPKTARGVHNQNFFSLGRKSSYKKLNVFLGDDDEPLPEDELSIPVDQTFNNIQTPSVETSLYDPKRPSAFAHNRQVSHNFESTRKHSSLSRVLHNLLNPDISPKSKGPRKIRRLHNEAVPPKEARESLGSPSFMSEQEFII